MNKNGKYRVIITMLIFFFSIGLHSSVLAGDPPDPCTDPTEACPIDGGISLLIIMGVAVGAKKAYDEHSKKNIANY